MKYALALAPLIISVPIIVAAAIFQGHQCERWGEFPEMKEFAARLERLPLDVGDWKGKQMDHLDAATRKYAGAEGDMLIEYTNAKTHQKVSVFAVCGRFLDMWKHRPDRCYPAGGYEREGEQSRAFVTDRKDDDSKHAKKIAEFETARFVKKEDKGVGTQIYWTWSSNGVWQASDGVDDFRSQFSRTRPIFKVYFQTDIQGKSDRDAEALCFDAVRDILPQINKVLFPAPDDVKSVSDTRSAAASGLRKSS